MAGVAANLIVDVPTVAWGVLSFRQDTLPLTSWLYTNTNRLASPFGPALIGVGRSNMDDFYYSWMSYTPPTPDVISGSGGAFRPTEGQLTP